MELVYALLFLGPVLVAAQDATTTPIPYTKVCYTGLGCYDNAAPFDNADGKVPKTPAEVGVSFSLFTRQNRAAGDAVVYNNANSVSSSHFSASKPTKFIIHGFGSGMESAWMGSIKDALLNKGDYNVIKVGWAQGAQFPDYAQAVANTRLVAAEIKVLLDNMVAKGANLDDVHLIGHSLGAQISGAVGKAFNGRIGRITGLDPARPSFENHPIAVRLDASDGKFVDVMHTNGEESVSLLKFGYGVYQQTGDVDFYVNGGRVQRGCRDGIAGVLGTIFGKRQAAIDRRDLVEDFSCSHGRAHEYFLESITSSCSFTGYKCDDYAKFEAGQCTSCANNRCNEMGIDTSPSKAHGKLYLDTNSASPFCSTTAGPLPLSGRK